MHLFWAQRTQTAVQQQQSRAAPPNAADSKAARQTVAGRTRAHLSIIDVAAYCSRASLDLWAFCARASYQLAHPPSQTPRSVLRRQLHAAIPSGVTPTTASSLALPRHSQNIRRVPVTTLYLIHLWLRGADRLSLIAPAVRYPFNLPPPLPLLSSPPANPAERPPRTCPVSTCVRNLPVSDIITHSTTRLYDSRSFTTAPTFTAAAPTAVALHTRSR
jgi:hypothetical protein